MEPLKTTGSTTDILESISTGTYIRHHKLPHDKYPIQYAL